MTLFGKHTVAELKDLLAAKDYDIHQIQDAFDKFAPTWKTTDPAALNAWSKDWNDFLKRYGTAHFKAEITINLPRPGVSDTLVPAEGEWASVLRALRANEGVLADTDFQGLHNRLITAMGKPIDFSQQPQPRKGTDADLAVFNATEDADVLGKFLKTMGDPSGKPDPFKWTLLLAGVAGVAVGGTYLYATHVPTVRILPPRRY